MAAPIEQKDYLQHNAYAIDDTFPQGINVLTILSFIGSAFQVFGAVFNYFLLPFSVKNIENLGDAAQQSKMNGMGSFLKWSSESTLKQYEYRHIMLFIALLAAALCIYGAWQMRKLKRKGLMIYSFGELLLPIITLMLIGFFASLVGFLIAAIFLILFAYQRKHLIHPS